VLTEPLSPELALVDPELGARARAALPEPASASPRSARTRAAAGTEPVLPAAGPASGTKPSRPYPFWARVTAALWLLVIGILIGGAAIPHAQDKPRILPASESTPCVQPAQPVIPDESFGRGHP